MKCEKIKLQKMVGNLLDKLRKLSMHELEWNSPQEIFSRPQKFLGSCPKFLPKAVSFPDAQNVAQG